MGKLDIAVDEAEVIKMLRSSYDRRLRELAAQYNTEGALEGGGDGKVSDTVLSHGLKLTMKDDKGSWRKGSLWVVTDPSRHPQGREVSCTPDQVLLTHTDEHGSVEDIVVLKSELDDRFELR